MFMETLKMAQAEGLKLLFTKILERCEPFGSNVILGNVIITLD